MSTRCNPLWFGELRAAEKRCQDDFFGGCLARAASRAPRKIILTPFLLDSRGGAGYKGGRKEDGCRRRDCLKA